jgi:hypothetical protein
LAKVDSPILRLSCLSFTNVVKCGEATVGDRSTEDAKGSKENMKDQGTMSVRATISFPPEVYETLEVIAKEKKVSIAWVVREAAEKYIADKWPLFRGQGT